MADGDTLIWQAERKPRRLREAVILIVLALVAVAVLVNGLIAARHAGPRSTAQVIAAAYHKSRGAHPTDPEDDALPAAEADAGYMWAKSHRIGRLDQCADYSAEFRRGCGDYLAEVAP